MSRYRKIEVRTWSDEKFRSLSAIAPSGQALWFFMLTGPHTGPIPGLFRAGRAAMAEELDWDVEAFDKAFGEVFQQGMAKADFKAKLVWLPNAIKHNKPESPNVVRGWRVELDLLPECDLKREAMTAIREGLESAGPSYVEAFDELFLNPEKPTGKSPSKASPKPSPKPSPKTMANQEQEQEQDLKDSEAKASDGKPSSEIRKERNPEDTAKAELWRTAVSVLAQGGCANEDQARSFMGKLVKDHGFDAVREAVSIAVAEQPADTREFLKATCQRIAGERKKPDLSRQTVPGRVGLDPAILAAEEARKNARPPSAETRARISKIRQGVAA